MLNRFTIVDLECVAAPDALDWYPPVEPDPRMVAELDAPVEADKRLTDPAKVAADIGRKTAAKAELPARIAEDIERRRAALIAAASLDADACQIKAVGLWPHNQSVPRVFLTPDEGLEAITIETVWQNVNASTPMLGYGVSFYDAGVLVRRSQLLGVTVPQAFYRQGKYRHDMIVELADYLTLNGMIEQKKGRGLDYHCRRFGIQVEDSHTGKDVAQLWKDGNIEGIKAHCLADITRIRLLAERLGVIQPVPAEMVL